jgi:outer membrane immunogenic protein
MKKIAIAVAALAMGSMSASAADLAARPYTKAPVAPLAVYNWGGFYIGGHIGGAWTNQEWVNTANTIVGTFGDLGPGQGFRQRGTGIFGGGHAGYNWQASNFVFGLEGTISGLDTHGTVLNTVFGAGLDDVFSWRSNWMATVTGRAGIAFNNNLFYVKGGYAGVNNRLAVSDTVPAFVGAGSQTHWHHGWTVGAGWEYGITRNWIVGLEYNYAAFGSQTYQLGGTSGNYTFDAKPRDIQWAVVRASYKFDAPVIARY